MKITVINNCLVSNIKIKSKNFSWLDLEKFKSLHQQKMIDAFEC